MLNTKIVSKNDRTIKFEARSAIQITPERAKEAQTKLGYMPAGYGFNLFVVKHDPVLHLYTATWSCSASCD